MSPKLDYEKARRKRRMAINGYEAVSGDYAEFPSKYGRNACTVIPKDRPHGLTAKINGLVPLAAVSIPVDRSV